MKTTKTSKSKSATDEEIVSKETLARRRDRKLKDDITNMMYRLEMESIKPSFDVILQTGIHRGLHSRYFRKRRPHASKSSQEESDRVDRRSHDRGLSASKDESTDWHSRPSTLYGDRDKRKEYVGEKDRRARSITNFRELSPVRYKTTADVAGSRAGMKEGEAGSSLSAMVMRASRLSTADLDDATSNWSSRSATLPRSMHYYPGAAVISVDELPRPQRGTYVVETVDGRSWSAGGGAHRAGGVRPVSMHDDHLMSYLYEAESTPKDFTLDSLLASQRQHEHQQNVYIDDDDEIGHLNRFLDNPFTGHNYERQQQMTYSDKYNSLPYTPKTIITSPSLRYT